MTGEGADRSGIGGSCGRILTIVEVLLISPRDPKVPSDLKFLMGGESTYTQSLLQNPPKGVNYTYFQDALMRKEIIYSRWQIIFSWLMKLRIMPLDTGYQCISLKKKFDLIHCHLYGVKIDGSVKAPVVLSDSSSNYLFLRDYLGWGKRKIKFFYRIRKFLAVQFGVYDPMLNPQNAPIIVWSKFAEKIHRRFGRKQKNIFVIPPGIGKFLKEVIRKENDKNLFNILFIGIWFERKGGLLVLEAYKKLKKKYPRLRLSIVGDVPNYITLPKEVWQRKYLPREKLIRDVFPKADALVLVPPRAEGFGVVALEAMSLGIPVIVSDVYALAETVEDGKTGLVIKPGEAAAVADAFEKLILNEKLRKKMGEDGRVRFLKKYTSEAVNEELLKVYEIVVK